MNPQFIKIGNRIMNLALVWHINLEATRRNFTTGIETKVRCISVTSIAPSYFEFNDGSTAPEADYITYDYDNGDADRFLMALESVGYYKR